MKYRLLGPHVTSDGRILDEGTIVGEGDDAQEPWKNLRGEEMPPTTQMEGLDDESRKVVAELHQQLYGTPPYWENNLPEEQREAREKAAKEQQKLDENSEPVSRTQKLERKMAEEEEEFDERDVPVRPGAAGRSIPPARQISSTATAAPTTGGVTRPSPGPATPKPTAAEDARAKKPNEEQYPKG